jgi:hypothetical protein
MNAVVVASDHWDQELFCLWLSKAWNKDVPYEKLADSEGPTFSQLDMKLAVGMAKMINAGTKSGQKQLKDRCDLEQSKLTGLGQTLKGRQYVRLLVDNFSTIDGSEQMFGLDHLMKITFDGDLHTKWMQWNRVRSHIQGGYVAEELVRDTLYRKIKSRPDLREDMRRYERAEPGSTEKTYKFLAASIEVAIKLEREERNLKEKDALLAPQEY